MSFEIANPRHLTPGQLEEIYQLIYDAFSDHDVLPYELDEWSTRGIAADLGGLFINTAARGGLFLAQEPSSEGEGEIVGILTSGQPKATLPPRADPPTGEEGKYVTSPPEPLPETEGIKKKREWRKTKQDPFNHHLFESAFGNPPKPACHITFIAVSPKAQKMGIGKALLQKAEGLGRQHGVGVTLMTDTSANMEYYTSRGYSIGATDELDVSGKMVQFWAMSKAA